MLLFYYYNQHIYIFIIRFITYYFLHIFLYFSCLMLTQWTLGMQLNWCSKNLLTLSLLHSMKCTHSKSMMVVLLGVFKVRSYVKKNKLEFLLLLTPTENLLHIFCYRSHPYIKNMNWWSFPAQEILMNLDSIESETLDAALMHENEIVFVLAEELFRRPSLNKTGTCTAELTTYWWEKFSAK